MKKSILDVLLERSSAALFLDAEGRIIATRGDPSSLLKEDAPEAIGRRLADLLEPAYRACVADIMERCLDSGRSEAVALRFSADKDAHQILFVPRDFTAARWPREAVIQVQEIPGGVLPHDISLISHELFTSIINDIGEGMIVYDSDLKITHVNDFAAQLLSIDKVEILETRADSIPERYLALMPGEETTRIFHEGLEFSKVSRFPSKGGKDLNILLHFYPVRDAEGKVTHVVETLQDITEAQKTADKIQRINRRLQEKVRELSVLNKLSADFNACTSGEQLYPRLTSTIVCGLGFHDIVAVLALRDSSSGELRLRSFFGTDEWQAKLLMDKPPELPVNVLVSCETAQQTVELGEQGLSRVIYSPIVINGDHIGYLNIFYRIPDPMLKAGTTLVRILSDSLGHFIKRIRTERKLREKVLTLSILKQISDALQTAETLDQIAYVFLTGVSAEQGLGFNRAFLFLIDGEKERLAGRLAIGPSTASKAKKIWDGLKREGPEFIQLLNAYDRAEQVQNAELNLRFGKLALPLTGRGLFGEALKRPSSRKFNLSEAQGAAERRLLRTLECSEFAVASLFAMDRPIGLLLVDNLFTGKPITDEDLHFLELVAKQGQAAIESYQLYSELRKKVEMLKRSNLLLQEHRTRLANLEKLGALGEMAAGVAHEIRNPLVTIGGFARSLLGERAPGDPDRKFLQIIADEVGRLETVVTNLLNYAKPLKPAYRWVSLREMIQQTVSMVEPEFADAGITIRTRLDRKGGKVWLDPDLIKQALLNIFNNSMQAMPEGGKLWVSGSIGGDYIRIIVRDSGHGIDKEELGKLFEPFFTTRASGVGLGLAIVHQIVRSHGGKITAQSNPGKGTTFSIRLPRI